MACPLSVAVNKSLDFVIFRTLAKFVDTLYQVVFNECRTAFNLLLMTDITRKQKIISYCASDNLICKVLASNAEREVKVLHLN